MQCLNIEKGFSTKNYFYFPSIQKRIPNVFWPFSQTGVVNYAKASIALEASTKIYAARVDSVYEDMHKYKINLITSNNRNWMGHCLGVYSLLSLVELFNRKARSFWETPVEGCFYKSMKLNQIDSFDLINRQKLQKLSKQIKRK